MALKLLPDRNQRAAGKESLKSGLPQRTTHVPIFLRHHYNVAVTPCVLPLDSFQDRYLFA